MFFKSRLDAIIKLNPAKHDFLLTLHSSLQILHTPIFLAFIIVAIDNRVPCILSIFLDVHSTCRPVTEATKEE